ncbi:unannotated protein [freshwater metagenome]|uniref:Unannotated protein n=1 Tax=freshwater metagenome TaxID=449393 RepID=A0A6J6GPN6_9ZZZZ
MNTSLCFCCRYTLHSMWAAFKLQVTPCIVALEKHRDLVDATHFGIVDLHGFNIPATLRCVRHVHFHEIAGEQVGFFSTFSTTDFHDDGLPIIVVWWQQQHLQLCFEFFHTCFSSIGFGTERITLITSGFDHEFFCGFRVATGIAQISNALHKRRELFVFT